MPQANVQQEKVLVFSHSIKLLSVVESLIERYPINGEIYRYNEDYFRLDGSKSSKSRQTDIDSFNHAHNTAARLYLVSTRAGEKSTDNHNVVCMFDRSVIQRWGAVGEDSGRCEIFDSGAGKTNSSAGNTNFHFGHGDCAVRFLSIS